MRFHRPGRLAAARRLSVTILSLLPFLLSTGVASAAEVTGIVVDSSDRPVPRAYVRILNGPDAAAGVFTDDTGRFALSASAPCSLQAALTGFTTTTVACGSELHVVLQVAPVREAVLVTATRTEAPASQVGASTSVFSEEDLAIRQQPLLADLLVGTPGAMLLRSGGPGTVTSLFVRGSESDYNKILLDGVPLNEPGGSFYLNNLTTENLERVEIVRGAFSSLFGSDAMASVVQLFTKRGSRTAGRPHATATLDGGSYGTVHANAAVSGAAAGLDYSLGAARLTTDNRVPNSALDNTTLSANVGVALRGTATLRFIGRAEREHVGTPGTTAFGRPDLDAFFERHDGIGSVSLDQGAGSRFHHHAAYSLATSNQQSTNLTQDPSYTATYRGRVGQFPSSDFLNDTVNALRRHHLGYQADVRMASGVKSGTQMLTLLADWDGERATVTDRRSNVETVNARDNTGFAAQQQMLWRRVFVTLGARIEHNASFGNAFVPRATVEYMAHEPSAGLGETRIRASAGTGIKEPTMLESFSVSPYFLGNPDLKPERSRSAELGVEQRLAHDRAKVEVTYFHNRNRDVIVLLTTNPSTFEGQYFNGVATRARGVEFGGEIAPTRYLRARAGYTWLDGEVMESRVPTDTVNGLGNELFRRPRHSGSVGVTAIWSRLTADLHGAFVGHFVDNDFGLFSPSFTESPGHTLWDARVSAKVTPQVTGLLSIDNLTNADYSEPLGYQPLLRAVRVGVRVSF